MSPSREHVVQRSLEAMTRTEAGNRSAQARSTSFADVGLGDVMPLPEPGAAMLESPGGARFFPEWRRFYLPVPVKFGLSLLFSAAWVALSLWLSMPWMHALGDLIGRGWAIVVITFIAYVPGFMNAFLLSTILMDHRPRRSLPSAYPGVTLLVACYNEANSVADTLRSIAAQTYPGPFEVLVLNDGSTDDTARIVRMTLEEIAAATHGEFRLVDFAANAGKAAVLNRGLEAAKHDYVVTVDGDCWLNPVSLQRIVERRVSDPPNTRAVAGAVLVRNSRRNWLTRAQEWDYFHGIAAVKRMQSMYHGTLVAQGAFSLYDRDALNEVGGWPECVGEDIVVSWGLLDRGYRIGYAEDAVIFTNVPERLRQFALQRKRWSRGLVEAFRAYPGLLGKRRMTQLFIWWNLFFFPLDLIYTFVFIPGILLALLGVYWIAGPMTLAVLPLAALWNYFIFRIQRRMLNQQGMRVRSNLFGFFFYVLAYSMVMQPVCVWGYFAELVGLRKSWDTK